MLRHYFNTFPKQMRYRAALLPDADSLGVSPFASKAFPERNGTMRHSAAQNPPHFMSHKLLTALAPLALFTAPAQAQEQPAEEPATECPANQFRVEGLGCRLKPPTPSQRECIETWDKRDDLVNALDVGTTAVGLALGATEVGLAGLAGPAAPVAVVALKLFSRSHKKAAIRNAYARGDYDKLCSLLKARNGITGAAVVSNVVTLGAM